MSRTHREAGKLTSLDTDAATSHVITASICTASTTRLLAVATTRGRCVINAWALLMAWRTPARYAVLGNLVVLVYTHTLKAETTSKPFDLRFSPALQSEFQPRVIPTRRRSAHTHPCYSPEATLRVESAVSRVEAIGAV